MNQMPALDDDDDDMPVSALISKKPLGVKRTLPDSFADELSKKKKSSFGSYVKPQAKGGFKAPVKVIVAGIESW